jgi:hypothetical protein
MSRYFVITGPGRCGTLWTTQALAQFPQVEAIHDAFFPWAVEADLARLQASNSPIAGAVSGPARHWIGEIDRALERPQWGCLWREPMALVRSHVEMHYQALAMSFTPTTEPVERAVRRIAHDLLGTMEATLRVFEFHNILVRNFFLERISQPAGFAELVEWLRIDGEVTLPPLANGMPEHDRKVSPSEWQAETRGAVQELLRALPMVQGVMATASEKCERGH